MFRTNRIKQILRSQVILACLAVCFMFEIGLAQKSNSELLKIIATSKTDTTVIQSWYKLALNYRKSNFDSLIYPATKGYELAKKTNNSELTIKGLLLIADFHFYRLSEKELLANAGEALRLAIKKKIKFLLLNHSVIFKEIIAELLIRIVLINIPAM
ncbi:MAG: hypothetical protein IPJ32_07315 [Sphingobacteriaceae bacterium]|nr:hypothetical protein [Sphingobacteriaceae bacterium]